MTLEEFVNSVHDGHVMPSGLSELLQALWLERTDNWQRAHQITQEQQGPDAARVHAYLHRREGDSSNADHWYSRANISRPNTNMDDEWQDLVRSLLK